MKHIFLILVLTVASLSCKKQVDYLLPTAEQKIVINCIINPDSIVNCTVFYAKGIEKIDSTVYGSNGAPVKTIQKTLHYDSTAIIKVYKANLLYDSMQYVGNGRYQGHIQPEAGFSYQLEVVADGNTLSATTTIPMPTPIDSVVLINKWMAITDKFNSYNNVVGKLITYFKDDANAVNYYDQIIVEGDTTVIDGFDSAFYHPAIIIRNYSLGLQLNLSYFNLSDSYYGASDFIANEGDMDYHPTSAMYNDKTFNGQAISTYIIAPPTSNYYRVATWGTLLRTTSLEYYTYRKAYLRNVATSVAGLDQGTSSIHNSLFPPNPYPAYSNIVGKGGVGIFAGYSNSVGVGRTIF